MHLTGIAVQDAKRQAQTAQTHVTELSKQLAATKADAAAAAKVCSPLQHSIRKPTCPKH